MRWFRPDPHRVARSAAALIALVIGLAGCQPAYAVTTTTGGGLFAGTVTLGVFPCTNCINGQFAGTVDLALTGLATATMSGLQVPYVAYWAAQSQNASALFNFDDTCAAGQPANLPPLIGTASGTFTVTGGHVSVAGQAFQGATLTGDLNWTRVGVSARLTLSLLSITASDGSTVALTLTNLIFGQSVTAFVWTNGPGTCAVPQTNQTAQIEGIELQPV